MPHQIAYTMNIVKKSDETTSFTKLINCLREETMYNNTKEKSFPTINEDLMNYYIELLSEDSTYCVNADIHYMITVKDEYKSCTDDDERREKFNSLPKEFQHQYNLKRDRVPFISFSTMIAELNHLLRKNSELNQIEPIFQIEHLIVLSPIQKDDEVRVSVYKSCASTHLKVPYQNQCRDKSFIENVDSEVVREMFLTTIEKCFLYQDIDDNNPINYLSECA